MNILLVEDDSVIADAICVYLSKELMQVAHAPSLGAAKTYIATSQFDLCILDISLPDGSGLVLLESIRRKKLALPVILLTAKDTVAEKIKGLNFGADDYMTKPFDFGELIARVNSVNRRVSDQYGSYLEHGELKYYPENKCAYLGGTRLSLSSFELRLLVAFLSKPNRILNDAHLKDLLYGANEGVASNALNVHLFNLRKKLDKNYIITERGLGYRLASIEELK